MKSFDNNSLLHIYKQKIKEKIAEKIGRETKEKYDSQKSETCNEKRNHKNPKT